MRVCLCIYTQTHVLNLREKCVELCVFGTFFSYDDEATWKFLYRVVQKHFNEFRVPRIFLEPGDNNITIRQRSRIHNKNKNTDPCIPTLRGNNAICADNCFYLDVS